MSAEISLSDEHVAELLKSDAKKTGLRFSALGHHHHHHHQPTSTTAPKANTRFLRNIIRETDSHNASLLAREAEQSRSRRSALRRLGREETEAEHDREYRKSHETGTEHRRHLRRKEEADGSDKRHRPPRYHPDDVDDSKRSQRPGRDHHQVVDGDRGRGRERDRDRDVCDGHRRRLNVTDDHGSVDEEGRPPRHDDRSSTQRRQRRRSRDTSKDERRRHRRRYHRPQKRSPMSSIERDHGLHRSHRHRRHHHHHRRSSRDSRRSRSPERPDEKEHGRGENSPRIITSADNVESDPLEDIIGPPPPSSYSRPKTAVRSRGRGVFTSSTMDSHFSSKYDPSMDVQPNPESEDDWDQALEALRDRQRWKQQGAERLRAAGFSQDAVKKWTSHAGEGKREDGVRWARAGEGREWDRGKVVDDDGQVNVRPEWGRLKGN